jgi:hypothetical protein
MSTGDNIRRRNVELKRMIGGKCSACGYDKNFAALDFHHVDPATKSFTLCSRSHTMYERVNEAKKCILLCRNCHAELHNPRYAAELFDQVFISTQHPSWNYSREEYVIKLFDPNGTIPVTKTTNQPFSPTQQCCERALKMYADGITIKKISRRCGVSADIIRRICGQKQETKPVKTAIYQPKSFAQNVIDSSLEISAVGYVRPFWMTDKVYDNIMLAAAEQREILAGTERCKQYRGPIIGYVN